MTSIILTKNIVMCLYLYAWEWQTLRKSWQWKYIVLTFYDVKVGRSTDRCNGYMSENVSPEMYHLLQHGEHFEGGNQCILPGDYKVLACGLVNFGGEVSISPQDQSQEAPDKTGLEFSCFTGAWLLSMSLILGEVVEYREFSTLSW